MEAKGLFPKLRRKQLEIITITTVSRTSWSYFSMIATEHSYVSVTLLLICNVKNLDNYPVMVSKPTAVATNYERVDATTGRQIQEERKIPSHEKE